MFWVVFVIASLLASPAFGGKADSGEKYFMEGRWPLAAASCERAIAAMRSARTYGREEGILQPSDTAAAMCSSGSSLADIGNATCGESSEALLAASKRLAESRLYMEDFPRSYELWKEINGEYPDDMEAGTYMLLLESIKKRDSTELEKKALSGNTAVLFRAAGLARMWLGDTGKGAVYLARAGGMDPADYISFFYLGRICEQKQDFDGAIEAYKKAVGSDPVFAQALNNLGGCLREKGSYASAIGYYIRAIAISPEDPDYHYNTGNAYGLSGMYTEALGEYKRALELEPGLWWAHFNMGNTYLSMGKQEEAVGEFRLYLKYWRSGRKDAPAPDYVKSRIARIEKSILKGNGR